MCKHTNPYQTPDRKRAHSVTCRENEKKVLHQPFGFPQDPNVDGLAHSQGSCSDGQGTYSVVNDYASVFFVSFKKERKKSIRRVYLIGFSASRFYWRKQMIKEATTRY